MRVGGTLAVTGVLGTHVLGNGSESRHRGFVVRVLLADLRVASKAGSHEDQGIEASKRQEATLIR